jgi:hypothetical protein
MYGIEGLEGVVEYNNAGDLLGLGDATDPEVVGALRNMNPIARQRAVNRLAYVGAPSKGSRAEMEKFFGGLPPHIKDGLVKGDLRLADAIVYSIKQITSKTTKMFETQDTKAIGLTNVSNAKLPKNQALLVSGITLLCGTSVDVSKDKVMATDYRAIENYPAICSGELNLKANKKQILPETNCYIFKTSNFHNTPLGYYKLANPRLIQDDVLIELTLELGTLDGLPANAFVYAALHGTITTP